MSAPGDRCCECEPGCSPPYPSAQPCSINCRPRILCQTCSDTTQAALGEAWESKDYVETPWRDSEAALASATAPSPPTEAIDADDAAGPTAEGQARRTCFYELGWFGKKARGAGLASNQLRRECMIIGGCLASKTAISRTGLLQRLSKRTLLALATMHSCSLVTWCRHASQVHAIQMMRMTAQHACVLSKDMACGCH